MDFSPLDTSVREAARRGELVKLLDSEASAHDDGLRSAVRRLATARDSDGRTLLYDAVVGGRVEDCRRVLDVRDDRGETASDVNMRDEAGWSPLMSACSSNRPEVARWLLDSGAKLDANRRDIFYAASKGGVDLMEVLVGERADVWTLRCRGSTLLHRAAGAGNVEVCAWLAARMRAAGVDVKAWVGEVRDGAGETVLDVVEDAVGSGPEGQRVLRALS